MFSLITFAFQGKKYTTDTEGTQN